MPMLPEERRQQIVTLINTQGSVYVPDLSRLFAVTEETIRRDLEKLELDNFLKRTYGGAVARQGEDELSFNIRKQQSISEKNRIATKATEFIHPGDTIFLDASTTALCLARNLLHTKEITVITNSARLVFDLAKNKDITVISTGGMLRPNSLSFVGPVANGTINKYFADRAFLSCKGVSLQHGATDSNEWEIEVKRSMTNRAREVILLADHTKFEHVGLATFAGIEQVTRIITNGQVDQSVIGQYQSAKKDIVIA